MRPAAGASADAVRYSARCSCAREDWRHRSASATAAAHRHKELARQRALDIELCAAPRGLRAPKVKGSGGGLGLDGKPYCSLQRQEEIGAAGGKPLARAVMLDALVENGSTAEELGPSRQQDIVLINTLLNRLYLDHTRRLLLDEAWCPAFASAAAAKASPPGGGRARGRGGRARVLVLGLGTGVPALAAARAGGEVVWVERNAAFASVMQQMAQRNGLAQNIRIVCVRRWAELARPAGQRHLRDAADATRVGGAHVDDTGRTSRRDTLDDFDAVVTEEVGDDPLAEGILGLARLARTSLLNGSGRFLPGRVRIFGQLLSVRIKEVCGFDLRGFNAFRSNEGLWYDAEHVMAVEELYHSNLARRLSPPLLLTSIDLNDTLPSLPCLSELCLYADTPGILNCITYWAELEMNGSSVPISFGPPADTRAGHASHAAADAAAAAAAADVAAEGGPTGDGYGAQRRLSPASCRARRQMLRFVGYERRVDAGDAIRLSLTIDDTGVRLEAPVDAAAEARGSLRRWPTINLLAYHFPMLLDEARNGAFDRALTSAIRAHSRAHGGAPPRVLDIGSGSGLLAMMAARAGATKVVSLEMVPQLATAAKNIIAANGHGDAVTILGQKSTEIDPAALGGRAELLVCEVVDDMLLGEGVLGTVADARRRLLTPDATIIPRGGTLWAVAAEIVPPSVAGLDLSDLSSLAQLQAITAQPIDSVKMQHHKARHSGGRGGGGYRTLSKPMRLFDFDWATSPLSTLLEHRESRPLPLTMLRPGMITALVVYFSLDLDGTEENEIATGPDATGNIAWDQSARYLPVGVRVAVGDELTLVARHTDVHLASLHLGGFSADMLSDVGLPHLVGNPAGRNLAVSMDAPVAATRVRRRR